MKFLYYILIAGVSCKNIQSKQQQFLNDGEYDSDDDDDNGFSLFFLFILGFFLLVFSAALLWYNERRQAINEYRLAQARDICQIGDWHNINPELNGQLVHINGQSKTDCLVEDQEFGIALNQCIQLKRYVEQLQFVQIEHKRKHQATTYTYELKWKSEQVCSAGFPSEYQNKPDLWVVKSQDFLNPDVKLGSFTLSESLKKATKHFEDFVPHDEQIQACQKLFGKEFPHIHLKDKDLYFSQSSGNDRKVGDLRICFKLVNCGNTTVVSQQFNDTFIPYLIKDKYKSEKSFREDEDEEDEGCYGGCCEQIAQIAKSAEEPVKEIDWIREKIWSKNKVFMMELSKSAATTYRTRFLGFLLMVIGFVCIFYPVIWLFSLLPLIGQFTAALLLFMFIGVSIIISLPICLLISLIAWMRYHPLYAFINILGLGLTIFLVYVIAGI